MSFEFDTSQPPFNLLSPEECARLQKSIDIAYFNPGEALIEPGKQPESLFLILKGLVEEFEDETAAKAPGKVLAQYRDGDMFGSLAILRGRARHRYATADETICRLIPRTVFQELVNANPDFSEFFHRDLATRSKLVALSAASRDMVGFSLARVDGRCTRPAVIVSSGTTIREAIRIMRAGGSDCLLVEHDGRFGMVTRTDMLDAAAAEDHGLGSDIARIASFDLATLEPNAYLFDALIAMTHRHIERVVVMTQGDTQPLGIVELTDVLGYLSSHSHVVGLRIANADSVDDLAHAAQGMFELVRSLFAQRVRMRFIMDLLAALNRRIVARLFELVVDPEIQDRVCLLVLGSEARGEQVMRTDQNNALVMQDDLSWQERTAALSAFTDAMVRLGYPISPRGLMVSNPEWVMSSRKWKKRLGEWIDTRDSDAVLKLSAMLDATPAAGNADLFNELGGWLESTLPHTRGFYRALIQPLTDEGPSPEFFSKVTREARDVNIKYTGILPLVHGVRTLALEARVDAANTFNRIRALIDAGVIPEGMGTDLEEAFSLFMQLRLEQQLDRHDRAAGEPVPAQAGDLVSISSLSRSEQSLLRGRGGRAVAPGVAA